MFGPNEDFERRSDSRLTFAIGDAAAVAVKLMTVPTHKKEETVGNTMVPMVDRLIA